MRHPDQAGQRVGAVGGADRMKLPENVWLVNVESMPEPFIRPGDPDDDGYRSDIYEWHGGTQTVQLYPSTARSAAEIGVDGCEPGSVEDAENLALALLAAVRTARTA